MSRFGDGDGGEQRLLSVLADPEWRSAIARRAFLRVHELDQALGSEWNFHPEGFTLAEGADPSPEALARECGLSASGGWGTVPAEDRRLFESVVDIVCGLVRHELEAGGDGGPDLD